MSESSFEWLILIITYFIPVRSKITSYLVFRKRAGWILLMKLTAEMQIWKYKCRICRQSIL